VTCVNCSHAATYLVDDAGANPLAFCRQDLPPHLISRADAGQFDIPEPEKTKKA
jgi:hypothetical protein